MLKNTRQTSSFEVTQLHKKARETNIDLSKEERSNQPQQTNRKVRSLILKNVYADGETDTLCQFLKKAT